PLPSSAGHICAFIMPAIVLSSAGVFFLKICRVNMCDAFSAVDTAKLTTFCCPPDNLIICVGLTKNRLSMSSVMPSTLSISASAALASPAACFAKNVSANCLVFSLLGIAITFDIVAPLFAYYFGLFSMEGHHSAVCVACLGMRA